MKIFAVAAALWASYWGGEGFFSMRTAFFPIDEFGKYAIQAEGIRLAFTRYGGALTNLWINDTDGKEIDIALGFDFASDYLESPRNPYLGGAIGAY
jgi:aldose 1-epimerase